PTLARLVEAAQAERAGRSLVIRPVQAYPGSASVVVTLAAGFPSAEGPNRTKAPHQIATFKTYAPLARTDVECPGGCRPSTPMYLEFNNPLDEDGFEPKLVTITPAIDDVEVSVQGNRLELAGATQARTTYKIVVAKVLRDRFGQELAQPTEATVVVGEALPSLLAPTDMVVLEATPKPTISVYSTNEAELAVKLYAVTPADYPAYQRYRDGRGDVEAKRPPVPGRKVFDQRIKPTGAPDQLVETVLDLSSALPGGLGHAILIVDPPREESAERRRYMEHVSWIQSTKLAINAQVDRDQIIALVSELGTGKPLPGIALQVVPMGLGGTSDARGVATIALGTSSPSDPLLVARRGADAVFVQGDGSWFRFRYPKEPTWYVVDDRQLYKPGEQVTLKGLVRATDRNEGGDLGAIGGLVRQVRYTVYDAEDVKLAGGAVAISPRGSFDVRFTLPTTPNLGAARVAFETTANGEALDFDHTIQIEEFRTPEFAVSAHASEGPFIVGGSGELVVEAKYFAGGPLAGADTTWRLTTSPATYAPPGHEGFTFGRWTPWWMHESSSGDRGHPLTFTSKTDGGGAHDLHVDFRSMKPAMPMAVSATASVMDVNRQAWTSSAHLLVHPAARYVGVKAAAKPYVEAGTPYALDVIGVDLDGKPAVGAKISVVASRLERSKDPKARPGNAVVEVDPETCAAHGDEGRRPLHVRREGRRHVSRARDDHR
ncbi:MAG: MG2 domain-containing protein, partial [Proteobacteria bacterium]|nr:MG2 domain-containing protein [Pseudomonadota bacterium]